MLNITLPYKNIKFKIISTTFSFHLLTRKLNEMRFSMHCKCHFIAAAASLVGFIIYPFMFIFIFSCVQTTLWEIN